MEGKEEKEGWMVELRKDVLKTRKLAREAFVQGDYIKAIRLYSDCIQVLEEERHDGQPEREKLWLSKLLVRRACAHQRVGNHYKAIQDTTDALDLNPTLQKGYLLKGLALLETEQFAQASETFMQGLAFHPNDDELKIGFRESVNSVRSYRHKHAVKSSDSSVVVAGGEIEKAGPMSTSEDAILDAISLALVDLSDVLEDEVKTWSKIAPDTRVFSKAKEMESIMGFFARNKIDLFNAFASSLALPKKTEEALFTPAGRKQSVVQVSSNRATAPSSEKQRSSFSRTEELIAEFENTKVNDTSLRVPLGAWARMTEDQFWEFVSDFEIITTEFGQREFGIVWKAITAGQRKRRPRFEKSRKESKGADHSDEGDQDERVFSILFPKFLEGIARLFAMRYQPSAKFDRLEGAQFRSASSVLPLSERVAYGFYKHILVAKRKGGDFMSSQVKLGEQNDDSKQRSSQIQMRMQIAKWFIKEIRCPFTKSKRAQQLKQLYEPRIHRLYDYFKQPTQSELSITGFIHMCKVTSLIDRYDAHLDEILSVVVAFTAFVGDPKLQTISFPDFFDILLWCCELKTRDGMVPFHHRLESFLVNSILRVVQSKTDIGNLFS